VSLDDLISTNVATAASRTARSSCFASACVGRPRRVTVDPIVRRHRFDSHCNRSMATRQQSATSTTG